MTGSLPERDAAHVWHPFTQARTAAPPLPVVAAEGSWLVLADGRRVLDGISSWWTNLHGHAHPRIAAAIAAQAHTLDHVHFAGCTHPAAVEAAERLVGIAPPGLSRVFFSDDGSTSVEVAVKMALQAWAQRGRPEKRGYVALEHGYHGDTVGALSVGDPGEFASPFGPLTFPVARVPTDLAALERTLARDGARTAALVLEPMVQAAGGMRIHPPAFLRGAAELCRAHDVLLVADEVMTGFGRTGRTFAVEHAGVRPDLLCVAKGLTGGALPQAATLATGEVFDAFLADDARRAFLHGHSYTANPIACAAAVASLAILAEEPVLQRVAALEAVHRRRLAGFRDHARVADVRGIGSLGVVELRAEGAGYFAGAATRVAAAMLDRRVLLRPLGPVVYLLPPYSTTPAELDAAYDALAETLDLT